MELKSYRHILRNKLLFNWLPIVRPAAYNFVTINERPIIVLGNQKAGTSAIAALLARATGNDYDIDIAGFRTPQYDALHAGKADFRNLVKERAAIEFSKGVVKEPNLTFLHARLRKAFPKAKFVFIVRSPYANIRSILNRLNLSGNSSEIGNQSTAEITPIWKSILFNEWGSEKAEKNYVKTSAERWVWAVENYLPFAEDTALIHYEDFNVSKKEAINDLAQRLGMKVTADISKWVDVQFQPKGSKPTSYVDYYGAENLRIINDTVVPYLDHFNYTTK